VETQSEQYLYENDRRPPNDLSPIGGPYLEVVERVKGRPTSDQIGLRYDEWSDQYPARSRAWEHTVIARKEYLYISSFFPLGLHSIDENNLTLIIPLPPEFDSTSHQTSSTPLFPINSIFRSFLQSPQFKWGNSFFNGTLQLIRQ